MQDNANQIEVAQICKRKDGGILLLFSIGFSVILVIGITIYTLARGCGYAHSFFLCTGAPLLLYFFLFVNLILIIFAIAQLIRPFFSGKVIKKVLILYMFIFLLLIIFDFVATNLKSTERECSIVGLYDSKSSEYCYFRLGALEGNNSYCIKSGENVTLCNRDVALKKGDYALCPLGVYYEDCLSAIAKRKLDLNGCSLVQALGRRSSCIEYVERMTN